MSDNKKDIKVIKPENVFYTVEHLKINVEDNMEGYFLHLRSIPEYVEDRIPFIINNEVKIDGYNIEIPHVDKEVKAGINSILVKWFNRELTMKTNVLAIDTIEDIEDIFRLEDGLLVTQGKRIVRKLSSFVTPVEFKEFKDKHFVAMLEPFKLNIIDRKIKIPPEMLTTPMDITRSRLFTIMDDYGIKIEEDKTNLLLDENNNLFIIDENMHRRIVMKVFTNQDLIVNQVTGL